MTDNELVIFNFVSNIDLLDHLNIGKAAFPRDFFQFSGWGPVHSSIYANGRAIPLWKQRENYKYSVSTFVVLDHCFQIRHARNGRPRTFGLRLPAAIHRKVD